MAISPGEGSDLEVVACEANEDEAFQIIRSALSDLELPKSSVVVINNRSIVLQVVTALS